MTLWALFLRLPDGIAEENLGGESAVEARFRAFLADGAVHLDVSLAEVANRRNVEQRRGELTSPTDDRSNRSDGCFGKRVDDAP